ncbi:SixA phosphatase family protein [Flavobacterium sp.]|uniref:SixA phosphatase family protein n=1 Tax=Flavobacterium sp. TaxID=239 RepID=UPI003BC12CBF
MKNIILIRHAKSSWEFPIPDKERELTNNGIKRAIEVANNSIPYIVSSATIWCSSAKRTLLTANIFFKIWNFDTNKLNVKEDLYTFDCSELEVIVKSCPNQCEFLILFGHNGAITDFVNKFGNKYISNVPTSGMVSINFDTSCWSEVTKGIIQTIIFPTKN